MDIAAAHAAAVASTVVVVVEAASTVVAVVASTVVAVVASTVVAVVAMVAADTGNLRSFLTKARLLRQTGFLFVRKFPALRA